MEWSWERMDIKIPLGIWAIEISIQGATADFRAPTGMLHAMVKHQRWRIKSIWWPNKLFLTTLTYTLRKLAPWWSLSHGTTQESYLETTQLGGLEQQVWIRHGLSLYLGNPVAFENMNNFADRKRRHSNLHGSKHMLMCFFPTTQINRYFPTCTVFRTFSHNFVLQIL